MAEPDLETERAHVARAYECLRGMHARTTAAVAAASSTASNEVDAAIVEGHLRQRLRSIDPDVPGLAFGRIDLDGTDEVHRIGRRHVEDDEGGAVVVDWRAPAAVAFYRATASDPLGLERRVRYATEGRTIEALFDEDLTLAPGEAEAGPSASGVPDPLLAELERERTGAMRDIVATIQAEQDVVIRAPLDECVVVQGGPGTGKTAVGLHRAAYLLYQHRDELDGAGVLVVGPNPTFLRYISAVLPSLGETSVRQVTLTGLLGRPVHVDDPARARLLGDARMADVVACAVEALRGPVDGDVEARTAWGTVRLAAADVAAAVEEVAARGVPSNVGRAVLRTRLLRLGRADVERRRGEGVVPAGEVERALGRDAAFGRALQAVWASATPGALGRRLLGSKAGLRAAAAGVLDPAEQAVVVRRLGPRGEEGWSAAELLVLDELGAALDGVERTYGHVVVDEAQDLDAMGFRALGRRCPSGSMTVLGDLAQATAPAAQARWDDALTALTAAGAEVDARVVELDVGYRVPAPAMALADRLLPLGAPGVAPTRSVREGGAVAVVAAGDEEALVDEVLAVVEGRLSWASSVGVVVDAGAAAGDALRAALAGRDRVQVVGAPESKGLEFDVAVVVEPAAIMGSLDDAAAGARLLYVTLTRAVQELVVAHHRPLPAVLVD